MSHDSLADIGQPIILTSATPHDVGNARPRFVSTGYRTQSLAPTVIALLLATNLMADGSATREVSLTSLRHCTRELLRLQATAGNESHREQATLALCDFYVRLRSDSRYGSSEMLKQDASKIRRRLLTESRRQQAILKRNDIQRPEHLTRDVEAALTANVAMLTRNLDSDDDPTVIGDVATDASTGSNRVSPTHRRSVRYNGFAAGGAFDNGWQLIELIQQVVAPEFWTQRGGPGTIQYFALRRVLVVSATTDVHEQIRDLLLMLSR
tara:strand:- start:561617 stop:562417 length:801 start_codon:yes stop_codon:yes gene_type:complete